MHVSKDEFCELLRRVYAGNEQAAAELYDRYRPAVLHVVRRNLEPLLRSKFDSLDFVQDVWKSFFANPPLSREFSNPANLVAYLGKMAHNKVIEANRQRLNLQKYNVNREVSLFELSDAELGQLTAPGQTPSEVVKGRDEWQRLLERQPLIYRRILIMVREGKTALQIGAELGVRHRSVRRIVARILEKLR